MTTEFRLPELGENITSGTVGKVLVAPGDTVEEGQNVIEIETDKAVAEIPCSLSGEVVAVHVKEGQEIQVGDTILVLEQSGAEKPSAPEEKQEQPIPPEEKPQQDAPPPDTKQKQKTPPEKAREGKVRAAPSVRQLAREHEVDLNEVPAADPSGRISASDIHAYLSDSAEKESEAVDAGGASEAVALAAGETERDKWGQLQRAPMNAIRKKAAEHLTQCWRDIPHVTHFDKAHITALEDFRLRYAKKAEKADVRLTVTAFLLKVLPEAFKRFPRFNASLDLDNKQLILKHYYHLGVAVDTPNGLVVPVLRDVDQKSILDISRELATLAEKARNRKLTIEEMQGGTFTLSNLGALGGHGFTPIINAPEVAVLGVSRAQTEAVYEHETFVPRLMLPLSLSYDHRVIDGADAARFLRFVAEILEEPWRMLLGL